MGNKLGSRIMNNTHTKRKGKVLEEKAKRGPGRPPLEDRKVFVSLRLRNSLTVRIQRIYDEGIAHGTSPWRSKTQMYEQLIVEGLENRSGENELIEESMQYLRAIRTADEISNQRREAQAALSKVKIELKELEGIGARKEAHHLFWETIRAFEDMNETIWRNWFLVEMKKAFPTLAAKLPKTRFVKLMVDDPLEPETLRKMTVEMK